VWVPARRHAQPDHLPSRELRAPACDVSDCAQYLARAHTHGATPVLEHEAAPRSSVCMYIWFAHGTASNSA
jgi:hypothetical protein